MEFSIEYGAFRLVITGDHAAEQPMAHLSITYEGIRMLTADQNTATITGDQPSVSDIVALITTSFPNARKLGLNVFEAATLIAARWPTEWASTVDQSSKNKEARRNSSQ